LSEQNDEFEQGTSLHVLNGRYNSNDDINLNTPTKRTNIFEPSTSTPMFSDSSMYNNDKFINTESSITFGMNIKI